MSRIIRYLPELTGDEQVEVASLMSQMTDDEVEQFSHAYRSRRRDPQTFLLLTLLGFFAIAGIQRFYGDQMLMGILYILTGGFCLVGTIYDTFNYKKLAADYNEKQAREVAQLVMRTR